MTTPSIYVADLAAYNAGKLHGVWIDATQETSDIWAAIQEMLKGSPEPLAEEWAIHDYEEFGSIQISECQSVESVRQIALFIEEHGDLGAEVLNHYGGDVAQAKTALEYNYAGNYQNPAEYAEELTDSTTGVPAHLEYYIDYAAMGRDMELNGDVFTIETSSSELHVFWNQ